MFLISSAWAQGGGGDNPLGLFLPLILIFVVFYFLLIRPQQKKQKAHKAKVGAIVKGDEVITNGGILGKVTSVKGEDTIMVEISKGVEVKVSRHMVADVVDKTGSSKAPKVVKEKKASSAKSKS